MKKAVRRSMGVSPMSLTGILPVIPADSRGETPLRLMGKMPMLLFQRAVSRMGQNSDPVIAVILAILLSFLAFRMPKGMSGRRQTLARTIIVSTCTLKRYGFYA